MTQTHFFQIFLALTVLTVGAFWFVARSTRQPAEVPYAAVNRGRKRLFIGLGIALLAFLGLTLPLMPYPDADTKPDKVVHVTSRQFAFLLTETPIASLEELNVPGYRVVESVPAGALIEFRVSTLDVTHGFSLYDPRGQLLTQTQAMPGYVNRLRVRLREPGTYIILCMEYCGLAHHGMRGAFQVTAASPNTASR